MDRKGYESALTREQYEAIGPMLENARKKTRPRQVDLYDVLCAILYVLKEGCRWRALPHDFPKVGSSLQIFPAMEWEAVGRETEPAGAGVKKIRSQGVPERIGAEVEVVKRPQLHKFEVMPRRWIVERSFAWLDKCRRLWKNCERKLATSLPFVVLAFLTLSLRRL